jgi:hypothetical protein
MISGAVVGADCVIKSKVQPNKSLQRSAFSLHVIRQLECLVQFAAPAEFQR